MTPPDVHIIIRANRSLAGVYVNSVDALHWLARQLPDRPCVSLGYVPAQFANELVKHATDRGLSCRVTEL